MKELEGKIALVTGASRGLGRGVAAVLAEKGAELIVNYRTDSAHAESLSYLLQDCAAATENLLLAAPALGLGACWLGIHPREERIAALRSIFRIPEFLIPVAGIAVGVPEGKSAPRTRFDPAKVHDAGEWTL